ncbi:MAG TPA: PD-(D/E)XK nuclease family protein [Bryobacteraceae bacterium]|jgi:ATP-dependent helicase/nuclease subunit B|nr:PD-(D/E)XK nuclease family protein [Bryobacteraceae bacterium]
MHESYFRAVESGGIVITASRRLARVLTQQFHAQQRELGRSVWNTPDILPLDAFLKRSWSNHVWRGEPCGTLLDPLQEQVVWEQVIRESPAGDSLLRLPETAQHAMEAWQLMQAYRLQLDGRFEASDDWAAFASWSRAFRNRCSANNWLEAARLPDAVAGISNPGEVYLAGFDEVTPKQSDLFETLGAKAYEESPSYQSDPERWILRDSTEEMRGAAAWARRVLKQNGSAQIGIIVPNLTSVRAKVERIFREMLDPGSTFADHERSFHVSLGPALDRYPVVSAALLMLKFACEGLALPQAGMLLRSPFLGGAGAEFTKRAQLDAKLRREGMWDVSAALLRDRAEKCPLLARLLRKFEKPLRTVAREQAPSQWSRDFSELLKALGWPGDRTLSSLEYQVVEKWHGLLSSLASLDAALPPISFAQALSRLEELAAAASFQVENEGAPIQIMGLLEASGLQFDHLWVMGLHDEALPAAANPNPFLPISLQQEHKLPHSSAERELEFALKLLQRLLGSARNIVLSYPATEGDRLLGPSSLLAGGRWLVAGESAAQSEWVRKMRASADIEQLHDEAAPPVIADSMQPGGASLFKDMAACPFRAFAKHRLGARPLEGTDLGVSKKDQGNAAHRTMALLWTELGSLTNLIELTAEEMRDLIKRCVESAIQRIGSGIGHGLERRRLERLLPQWLEIEKARDWFAVQATEQDRLVTLGGLQIRTRADRIDQLANGREIILDYKTGIVKFAGWDGDRPDEPQLPLYCATSDEPIAGAAFALIRIGEMGFRGGTEDGVSLPALKEMRAETPRPFGEQIEEWKRVLERLATNFGAGLAQVDPKPGACDLCGLRALCRIREFENDRR